jgi:hypothetical protein
MRLEPTATSWVAIGWKISQERKWIFALHVSTCGMPGVIPCFPEKDKLIHTALDFLYGLRPSAMSISSLTYGSLHAASAIAWLISRTHVSHKAVPSIECPTTFPTTVAAIAL